MKSIGITDAAHSKLKRYCERHELGLGEFISTSLTYFEKHGLHPATHESPAAEMNRLIKRLDQVIAFIRKQESDLLRPMVEAVSLSEARIAQHLEQAATASQVQQVGQSIADLVEQLNKLLPVHQREAAATRSSTEQLLAAHARREMEAFQLLAKLIDAKERSGFRNDIGKLYSEQK